MPTLNLTDTGSVRAFEREAREVLQALAEKWGCTVRGAGGRFDHTGMKASWEFKPKDESREAEKRAFANEAFLFGLKPEDYGRQFESRGNRYAVVGFKPSRPKFPILARPVLGGKELLFTRDVLSKLR